MTVYQRTKRDAKRADRDVRKGQKLYVIREVSRHVAPYEDKHLYDEYTVSHRHPLMPGWMISGSLSVEGLVLRSGPVYTEKPTGLRGVHQPAPQVAGPLPHGYEAPLDEVEIRGLEKQVADGSNPRTRRRFGSWRV
ncbi:hypothetical protein [Streptomyces sp. NRRL F-5135]|uniref:hypothetical protein n=1 Tax=Streptomyces sp. NRRL F-5135 TaxID=1463858 RepID=UPI0004C56B18|nr:hypothetical protein [Streptomyces sp. NRRL F-5135]